jgi:hypothetical protein
MEQQFAGPLQRFDRIPARQRERQIAKALEMLEARAATAAGDVTRSSQEPGLGNRGWSPFLIVDSSFRFISIAGLRARGVILRRAVTNSRLMRICSVRSTRCA